MAAPKKPAPKPAKSKVVLEFNVLDDATKKKVAQCIERRGKVTVTMMQKGNIKGLKGGGFQQLID
jgi:ribosomal protein L23